MGRGSEGRGRYRAQLSGDRLRRRTEPDPQPDGGLRRLRCADGPCQAHRGQAAAIPHRDGRRRRHREPARHQAQRDQAHRRDPGRHLRRHHHEMERSQAGRTQPRREAAEPGDRSGASRRRLRHHLRVHLLSLGGQSGVEEQGRRQHQRELAGRRRRQGQRRRRRHHAQHARRHRLCRERLRDAEQAGHHAASQQGRSVCRADHGGIFRRGREWRLGEARRITR